jgi:hypothetical protein
MNLCRLFRRVLSVAGRFWQRRLLTRTRFVTLAEKWGRARRCSRRREGGVGWNICFGCVSCRLLLDEGKSFACVFCNYYTVFRSSCIATFTPSYSTSIVIKSEFDDIIAIRPSS